MDTTVRPRDLRLTRPRSSEDVESKLSRTTHSPKPGLFGRPVTALAQHQPHELSEISEISGSSSNTSSQKIAGEFIDGTNDEIDRPRDKNAKDHFCLNVGKSLPGQASFQDERLPQSESAQSDIPNRVSSALSLPKNGIPKRTSSISVLGQRYHKPNQRSVHDDLSADGTSSKIVSYRGPTASPVRHATEKGPQSSDARRTSSSRTFIRTTIPREVLDGNLSQHPRFEISARLQSPLFVGGGTIEGQVEIRIDATSNHKARTQPLFVSKLSIDVVGVEEVEDGRRRIFLSLATDVFDRQHPPPPTLVMSQSPEKGSELCWQTRPATSTIPFCVNLPLKLGPPPYFSRQASIRYLLCPSAVIKIGGKRHTVRQTWNVQMLTTHDPEKALASLPSPLVATDTLTLSRMPVLQTIRLTAGLHRQIWVNGGLIFVDLHIINRSDKIAKRIELQLQKSVLWFSHSAAETAEKSASNLRLPKKIDTEVVCRSVIKKSKEWDGVHVQCSETRTCELDIPKGHVTVGNGRFFEVRYFVKATVATSRTKSVSVQLPVTIIHMNSLDILPNSIAQVAASIEAKRSNATSTKRESLRYQTHKPGQAFKAARQRSLIPARHTADSMVSVDIDALTRDVDQSPRRAARLHDPFIDESQSAEPSTTDENRRSNRTSCCQHSMQRPSCYHCHLMYVEHAAKASSPEGPKLPRLQVSTSGLGFSESEFELPPDSPRKVMLSEQERRTINQQRELRMRRQYSQQKARDLGPTQNAGIGGTGFIAWRNVAALPALGRERRHSRSHSQKLPERQVSHRSVTRYVSPPNLYTLPLPARSGSKTGTESTRPRPEGPSRAVSGIRKPGHGTKSVDRGRGLPRAGLNVVEGSVSAFSRSPSVQ